jgi:hypothetical protein
MHFLLEDWLKDHTPVVDKMYYRHKPEPMTVKEAVKHLKQHRRALISKCKKKDELSRSEVVSTLKIHGRTFAMRSLLETGFPKPRYGISRNHQKMYFNSAKIIEFLETKLCSLENL